VCSSGITFALLLSDEYQLRQLVFWLAGGAEARTWHHVVFGAPPIVLGLALLWSRHRWLDALSLGEDHAGAVGGAMVVPLNALLQHRGHQLLAAGSSIAVQGFNENLSVLAMLGVYALCLHQGLDIVSLLCGLGLLVAASLGGLLLRTRALQHGAVRTG
jgi:ABC-type Fe3+-siderophore transport system permease subunit